MSDILGFDPKTFSDEEIQEKYTEILKRLNWVSRFSGNPQMGDQLLMMLQALKAEQAERTFNMIWKMRQSMTPEVIETDPDLKDKRNGEESKKSNPRDEHRTPFKKQRSFSITKAPKLDAPKRTSKPDTGNNSRQD